MSVVRFLERENVIRGFGAGLIGAPFVNMGLHIYFLKNENHLAWAQVNFIEYLKSGNIVSYCLAAFSVLIGFKMMTDRARAWSFVLFLIGAHLLIQIININNKAWQGPMAWPSFGMNAILFFFIVDQLVWKVKVPEASKVPAQVTPIKERHVINLKSYRKILFSFGSDKPWGELKTLSSEELGVKCVTQAPAGIENQIVQINFARDVVVEIQYSHENGGMLYFKPLNMQKDQVTRLNNWLKKIAV